MCGDTEDEPTWLVGAQQQMQELQGTRNITLVGVSHGVVTAASAAADAALGSARGANRGGRAGGRGGRGRGGAAGVTATRQLQRQEAGQWLELATRAATRLQRWARRRAALKVMVRRLKEIFVARTRLAASLARREEEVRLAREARQVQRRERKQRMLKVQLETEAEAVGPASTVPASVALGHRQRRQRSALATNTMAALVLQRAERRRSMGARLASIATMQRAARCVQRQWQRVVGARAARRQEMRRHVLQVQVQVLLAAVREAEAERAAERVVAESALAAVRHAMRETEAAQAAERVLAEATLAACEAARRADRAEAAATLAAMESRALAAERRARDAEADMAECEEWDYAQHEVAARASAEVATQMEGGAELQEAATQTEEGTGAVEPLMHPAQAEMAARAERAAGRMEELAREAERRAAAYREHPQAAKTGGRQVRKARVRQQAAAAGYSVIDWLQVQESQRRLFEVVGGGALAPRRLEERLDRAQASWRQQQEVLWGAPD